MASWYQRWRAHLRATARVLWLEGDVREAAALVTQGMTVAHAARSVESVEAAQASLAALGVASAVSTRRYDLRLPLREEAGFDVGVMATPVTRGWAAVALRRVSSLVVGSGILMMRVEVAARAAFDDEAAHLGLTLLDERRAAVSDEGTVADELLLRNVAQPRPQDDDLAQAAPHGKPELALVKLHLRDAQMVPVALATLTQVLEAAGATVTQHAQGITAALAEGDLIVHGHARQRELVLVYDGAPTPWLAPLVRRLSQALSPSGTLARVYEMEDGWQLESDG